MTLEKVKIWLAVAAAIISTLTPLSYLVGAYFFQGYLEGFGISSDFFEMSFQEIMMMFHYCVMYALIPFIQSLNTRAFWIPVAIFVFVNWLYHFIDAYYSYKPLSKKPLRNRSRWFRKLRVLVLFKCASKRRPKTNAFFKAVERTNNTTNIQIFCFLILLLSVYFLFTGPNAIGLNLAKESIASHLKGQCKEGSVWSGCYSVIDKNGKGRLTGYLIYSDDKTVAIFHERQTSIIQLEQGDSITRLMSQNE